MGKHKGRPPVQLSVLQGEDLALRGRLAEEAKKIRDEVVSLTPPFPEGSPCHLIRLQTRGSVPHFATPEALRAVVEELNRLSERYFQLGTFVITPTELGLCLALGENPGSGKPYTLRFVLGKLKTAVARAALRVSEGLEAEFGISPEVLRRDPQRFWHGEAVVRDLRERYDWERAAVELAVLPAIRNYCPEPLAYPASWFNLDPERYGELMAGQFPLSSDYLNRQAEIARQVREIDQGRYREAVSGLPRDFVPSRPFRVVADFEPTGDQPEAIEKLVEGYRSGAREQVLLGVTGVGKTFILAKVIEQLQLPTLVLAHNKTLAAQLCSELRAFFPDNAVEYFVSYYDYYQPEAYIPQTNTYIEKEADINEEIDRLRHAATEALLTRRDVIVVASVSCIYGLGSPEDYEALSLHLVPGMVIGRERLIRRLVDMQYRRNQLELERGCFRVRGDTVEVFPADKEEIYRLELFDDELEAILVIDPLTFRVRQELDHLFLYPSTHYVLIPEKKELALKSIEWELEDFLPKLLAAGKLLEAQRLRERVNYDLEMLRELGYCNGIENYSRHFSGKLPGEPPSNLLDYFPEDFFLVIDESHVTIPQVRGMYNGDRSRKETLVEYGFRLPSALDNRPLRFDEFQRYMKRVLYMSATPGDWELARAEQVAEAVIRPTGLVDPKIEVHPTQNQIDHLIGELREVVKRKQRALVTTLTKKMAEKLAEHLEEYGFKVNYLHSDIDTVERIRILRDLRAGVHDVVVGVNLLREGLDLPEVALVAILDADKEGFLRSDKSLVQIIGRAARNLEGRVLLYADRLTPAMERAIEETNRRRDKQLDYNRRHNITPRSIRKPVRAITDELEQAGLAKVVSKRSKDRGRKAVGRVPSDPEEVRLALITPKATGFDPAEGLAKLDLGELQLIIVELEQRMELLAQELEYEKAALLRDRLYAAEKELDRRLRQKKPEGKLG